MSEGLESEVGKECSGALYKWIKRKHLLHYNNNYGIRVYRNGSVLHPHTDVLETHVLSCIFCVHATDDGAADWPVSVTDLKGVDRTVVRGGDEGGNGRNGILTV